MLPGRRLVVDTSIARAAGPPGSSNPKGALCRECLEVFREAGHSLVWSDRIRDEWNKKREDGRPYASTWSRQWLELMFKRGRFHRPSEGPSLEDALRDSSAIEREQSDPIAVNKAKAAMIKDVHLVDAALASDRTVLSLDEIVRRWFGVVAREIEPIGGVMWSNPAVDEDGTLKWLRDGARPEEERKLGAAHEG